MRKHFLLFLRHECENQQHDNNIQDNNKMFGEGIVLSHGFSPDFCQLVSTYNDVRITLVTFPSQTEKKMIFWEKVSVQKS
jgi:hypothetical protein